MTIGSRIKMFRELRGWTQVELAEKMEYKDHSSIGKIEKGLTDVSMTTVKKFANVLGVSYSELACIIDPEFQEYIPYLKEASEETIRNIRYMLKMPELKKGNCASGQEKVV